MDEVKRIYRTVKTDVKKTARRVNGTSLRDRVANAGDDASRKLGNLGDDVRKAAHKPEARSGDPAATPKRSA